jgi:hypothetical protein
MFFFPRQGNSAIDFTILKGRTGQRNTASIDQRLMRRKREQRWHERQ